jgi:hypothetical protein
MMGLLVIMAILSVVQQVTESRSVDLSHGIVTVVATALFGWTAKRLLSAPISGEFDQASREDTGG